MFLLTSCGINSDMSTDSTDGNTCPTNSDSISQTTHDDDVNTIPERTYTFTGITYSEPTAQYAFRVYMYTTETAHAKYFFESGVANEEREACIEVTERVLLNLTRDENIPEIYIFSNKRYGSKYIDNYQLYCSVQDWKSIEYITDVLLTAYSETAHYGTAFGYANHLSKSYKWGGYNGNFCHPSVKDILDLSYLCFDEAFAILDDVTIAKGIACNFVDSYINQHGEKAIQLLLCSHSKALDALSVYYADNGLSYSPSHIQYAYGGESHDYIVYSDYGTFYVGKDWVDINAEYNPLINDGFLHSNYADTKTFFETNIKQMKQYQDLFKLAEYNDDLDIILTKPISASKSSFYQALNHRIYLYNIDSLTHEYIHALTQPKNSMTKWQVEGFARYFSYYYDIYGIAFLNQDYNNTLNGATTKYIHEYLAQINRPIDMAKDFCELENIAAYYFGFTDPDANYAAGSSFVQYLVKQYGEEVVIDHIYGSGNPLPKPYGELVIEWREYIKTNYNTYSRYE